MTSETPLWQQDIPFKTALAVVAAQRRRCEARVDAATAEAADAERRLHDVQTRLGTIKWSGVFKSHGSVSDDTGQGDDVSSEGALATLLLPMTLWSSTATHLPPSSHIFASQVLQYSIQCRLDRAAMTTQGAGVPPPPPPPPPPLPLIVSPIQATIDLVIDVLRDPVHEDDAMAGRVVGAAAVLLGHLFALPETQGPADFDAFHGLVEQLLDASCNEKATHATAPATASRVLVDLQQRPETGLVVLGAVSHMMHVHVLELKRYVLGEDRESEAEATATAPASTEATAAEAIQAPRRFDETALSQRCIHLASILQGCLRALPAYCDATPPEPAFLRSVTAAIVETNEACQVIGPAHPEVGRVGGRCASALVSALQVVQRGGVG